MNDVKNPFLQPNKTVAVIGYILLYILGSSFFLIFIAMLYNFFCHLGLGLDEVLKILTTKDFSEIDTMYRNLYVVSTALGNFFIYLFSFLLVAFFMRDYLKKDGQSLISGYKKLAWLIPLCAAVGYGISYAVDYGIGKAIQQTSVNQSSIEFLIHNGGAVWMFFAVVVFAPIVEELIYRKAIFEYLKKFPIALSYVISIFLFTMPHVITTFMDGNHTALENFLISVPYILSGFLLCLTYHISGKNIYASWFFHLINNLLSFIILFI